MIRVYVGTPLSSLLNGQWAVVAKLPIRAKAGSYLKECRRMQSGPDSKTLVYCEWACAERNPSQEARPDPMPWTDAKAPGGRQRGARNRGRRISGVASDKHGGLFQPSIAEKRLRRSTCPGRH